MGSKFALPWGVQKPPAVCKKPPAPMPFPPPPWPDAQFQGFCQWFGPAYGYPIQLSGPVPMKPNPPAAQHIGWLNAPPFALRLRMTQTPAPPDLTLDLQLYLNSAPIQFKTISIGSVKSIDPLDTGLLQFPVAAPGDLVTCRVWS